MVLDSDTEDAERLLDPGDVPAGLALVFAQEVLELLAARGVREGVQDLRAVALHRERRPESVAEQPGRSIESRDHHFGRAVGRRGPAASRVLASLAPERASGARQAAYATAL